MTKRGLRSPPSARRAQHDQVDNAVKTINAAKPDAVVMISQYTSCAEFIRQMKRSGSAATFYNVSFVGSKALADASAATAWRGDLPGLPFPWGRRCRSSRSTSGSRPRRATPISISARSRASSWPSLRRRLKRNRQESDREAFIDAVGGCRTSTSRLLRELFAEQPRRVEVRRLTIIAREGKFLR